MATPLTEAGGGEGKTQEEGETFSCKLQRVHMGKYLIKDGVGISHLINEELVSLSCLLHHNTGCLWLLQGRFTLTVRERERDR